MQRRFIINALSAISIQEVQSIFNNLFTGCHGCPRVGERHFQRLYYGGTIYIIWVIVRPLLVMRLHSVFSWTSCINLHVCVWTKLFRWGCEYFSFSACRIYLYPCAQQYHNMMTL